MVHVWSNPSSPSQADIETINFTMPVIDFIRSPYGYGRTCIIDLNGVLSCEAMTNATQKAIPIEYSQPLAQVSVPLNRSNRITGTKMSGGVSLLIEGQLICFGEISRLRMGGYAMQPRQTHRRIIQINSGQGIDRPFCGQIYFKPCATLDYAMSLIESAGPWVEFQLAAGDYQLDSPITIGYTGITIRGSLPETRLTGAACLILTAPSIRLIQLSFDHTTNAITVNSGIFKLFCIVLDLDSVGVTCCPIGLVDIQIIDCSFYMVRGSAVQVLSYSNVAIMNARFIPIKVSTLTFPSSLLRACMQIP
jgi:hypothetical protein